jgi:hypothetical protein
VRSATSSGAAKLVTPQDAAGFARVIPSRRHDQGSRVLFRRGGSSRLAMSISCLMESVSLA